MVLKVSLLIAGMSQIKRVTVLTITKALSRTRDLLANHKLISPRVLMSQPMMSNHLQIEERRYSFTVFRHLGENLNPRVNYLQFTAIMFA